MLDPKLYSMIFLCLEKQAIKFDKQLFIDFGSDQEKTLTAVYSLEKGVSI